MQQTDTTAAATSPVPDGSPAKFGTFGGVFTPSILTIFGVIMFMRAGFVIGQAGILSALIILLVAKSITIFTGFSISAIATNTEVKSGGAYFLISRTLGPEFGGAIGIALYTAQALSVPFYILGFTEALSRSVGKFIPFLSVEALAQPIPIPYAGTWFFALNTLILIGLFTVAYVGAAWAVKAQYVIMGVLVLSIATFMSGAALNFSPDLLSANWNPGYTEGNHFWIIFAIYFPAVTGIMAGVNMSGNLKDPAKAIPLGSMLAVLVGLIVYGIQIVLVGGAVARETLINHPYECLMQISPFHLGFMVAAGVICATLSSGLGSILGAPRILQALAQDRILRPLNLFAKLTADGEPRRALWITGVLSVGVLYWAREGGTGGALNAIAALVTMLFLCTYGITNLAAFVESFGRNPSFRPRFRLFHWSIALLGAVGCAFAAFLIDEVYAFLSIVIVTLLFLYVRKFLLDTSFGDARRGFYYSRVRDNLIRLAKLPVHPKNWRPTVLVLTGNPESRLTLAKYATWLGSGRGIVTMASLILGEFREKHHDRVLALETLDTFIEENRVQAFPQVLTAQNFDIGFTHLLQTASVGPLRANLLMWGWSDDPSRSVQTVRNLQIADALGMSQIIIKSSGFPDPKVKKRRIDVWWRGKQNGSLMVILSYLLSLNSEWSGSSIRVLRVVSDDTSKVDADTELSALMADARMDNAQIETIISKDRFADVLHKHSHDTTAVFLGFGIPEDKDALLFQQWFSHALKGMPTTMLVHSTGEADLTS